MGFAQMSHRGYRTHRGFWMNLSGEKWGGVLAAPEKRPGEAAIKKALMKGHWELEKSC